MGMFDSIHLVGKNDPLLCGEGHELREFHTKDLECAMDNYYIFEGCLYRMEREDSVEYVPYFGGIEVVTKRKAAAVSIGLKTVNVYTTCRECLPVLYESDANWGRDQVTESHAWVEYTLAIDGGIVREIRPVRVETREALRLRLPTAIPDDDRVARRHFERLLDERAERDKK